MGISPPFVFRIPFLFPFQTKEDANKLLRLVAEVNPSLYYPLLLGLTQYISLGSWVIKDTRSIGV